VKCSASKRSEGEGRSGIWVQVPKGLIVRKYDISPIVTAVSSNKRQVEESGPTSILFDIIFFWGENLYAYIIN
jgi:hypothetical protein